LLTREPDLQATRAKHGPIGGFAHRDKKINLGRSVHGSAGDQDDAQQQGVAQAAFRFYTSLRWVREMTRSTTGNFCRILIDPLKS